MAAYCTVVRELELIFDGLDLQHVKRSDNMAADSLALMGTAREPVPDETSLEILHKPSIKIQDITDAPMYRSELKVSTEEAGRDHKPSRDQEVADNSKPEETVFAIIPDWRQPLLSKAYTIIKGELYKRSVTGVFQCCVWEEEGR